MVLSDEPGIKGDSMVRLVGGGARYSGDSITVMRVAETTGIGLPEAVFGEIVTLGDRDGSLRTDSGSDYIVNVWDEETDTVLEIPIEGLMAIPAGWEPSSATVRTYTIDVEVPERITNDRFMEFVRLSVMGRLAQLVRDGSLDETEAKRLKDSFSIVVR